MLIYVPNLFVSRIEKETNLCQLTLLRRHLLCKTSSSSSVVIPGTEIPVLPELLPPVQEEDPGGLLDEIGEDQAPQVLPQQERTGDDAHGPEPMQVERRPSVMSNEPEPQPTPAKGPVAAPALPPEPSSATASVPSLRNRPRAFRDPARLDGYHPVRERHGARSGGSEQPYIAEAITTTVRESRLRRMVGDISEYELDMDDEGLDPEDTFLTSADVLLTGKAVRSEIKLKDLAGEDREAFQKSMAKEWDSWMKFNAVEIPTPSQVRQLPKDVKIIGTRWIHTDKSQKQRRQERARRWSRTSTLLGKV